VGGRDITKDEVRYTKANAESTIFSYTGNPRFAGDRHIDVKPDGYLFRDQGGSWAEYDLSGPLLSRGDRNDVEVSFLYESGNEGRLIGVSDHFGNQLLWYGYDPEGRISFVEDAAGTRVFYEYIHLR
jgi:YD repeat-containing protein